VCVCVGSVRTEKWLIEEQLSSWRHPYTSCSRINIYWAGVSVSNSAGASVQMIFVSHSYQTWFTCFSGNWCVCVCVAWSRGLHQLSSNIDANPVITWSRNPHAKKPILGKPSKLGLIGVWHKDNLYAGTSTIGNKKPSTNEYWFANQTYKNDAMKLVVLWLVVFNSLENHGKEIISPTHRLTKCGKQEIVLI
jgi:hypothetical protein